jgi:hypothetical protein
VSVIYQFLINLDVRTQSLVQSYLLCVKSEKPKINQSFVTKVIKGRETWQKLPITNPTDKELEVEIVSSKSDLIIPVKKIITLQPNETAYAVLYFAPFPRRAKREVFIFVNEAAKEQSKFNHAFMIEIEYEQP